MSGNELTLSRAFGLCLQTGAALLATWKGQLSPERLGHLAAAEALDMRLGLAIVMPADRWLIQITLTDRAGGVQMLDTIEQAGALPSIN